MKRAALVFLPLLALLACKREDMYAQGKSQSWDASSFLAKGTTMQAPPAGTIARNAPDQNAPMPASITMALLARGQERFDIDCAPCHGRAGDGHGMIVERGFPQPPDLASPELRRAKAADLYDVITNGHGVMYGYASRMASPDRWAVIAYIRALQLGRDALVAALPAADRDRLAQTP